MKKIACSIVDGPYKSSETVYNARAKGNIAAKPNTKPWGKFLQKFYVSDGELYTGDGKQVKVWHYCDGFGNLGEQDFEKLMNNYIKNWFNDETKIFFKEECSCGDFFEKDFKVEDIINGK